VILPDVSTEFGHDEWPEALHTSQSPGLSDGAFPKNDRLSGTLPMTPWTVVAVAALCGLLAACADSGPKSNFGSVAGTLSGGLIGSSSRAAEPAPGAAPLLAAWTGSAAGARLDDADRRLVSQAEYDALESTAAGASREWRNPANGHRGSVSPGPAYSVNQYTCRDYVDQITVDGRTDTVRATACRQPDGSWRPIS
jgi:surface antigen